MLWAVMYLYVCVWVRETVRVCVVFVGVGVAAIVNERLSELVATKCILASEMPAICMCVFVRVFVCV